MNPLAMGQPLNMANQMGANNLNNPFGNPMGGGNMGN